MFSVQVKGWQCRVQGFVLGSGRSWGLGRGWLQGSFAFWFCFQHCGSGIQEYGSTYTYDKWRI